MLARLTILAKLVPFALTARLVTLAIPVRSAWFVTLTTLARSAMLASKPKLVRLASLAKLACSSGLTNDFTGW